MTMQQATMTMQQAITMINEKKPVKFRHELKYTINSNDDLEIRSRLRKLFRHDKHADAEGSYRISSLYFDTPYDKALREKLDGINQREKFRIRYYNNDLSFIRLEKKIKVNGLCGKLSAPLTAAEVEQILQGDYDFLLRSENALLQEFYSKLKGQLLHPRTIVCYDREAFLYEPGNVRITIDRNLRSGLSCTSFLDPNVHFVDISNSLPVLEVKYDAFLPEIVQMAVQVPNRRAGAYSKYAACRRYD